MSYTDIIHGDCGAVLKDFPEGHFGVAVTSPPYNIGLNYGTYRDRMPYKEYLSWADIWVSEVARVLADDGSLFVVVADLPVNPSLSGDLAAVAEGHLKLQNKIVWAKSIHIRGRTHGHHRPTTSPRYLDCTHEMILHFTKRGDIPIHRHAEGVGVPYADPANSSRWKHAHDRRCRGTVWFVPQPTITRRSQRWGHPASFPVRLAERCVRLHGVREGLRVLDPFGGVGSTACAAKRLGLDATLIEINPAFVATARTRVAAFCEKAQSMLF